MSRARDLAPAVFFAASIAGCACGSVSAVDASVDAFCAPDPPATAAECCRPGAEQACQMWAERLAPGMDAASTCPQFVDLDGVCMRADACHSTPLAPDGGSPGCYTGTFTCTCGGGPPCDPGYVCARPLGDMAPRRCMCASGTS